MKTSLIILAIISAAISCNAQQVSCAKSDTSNLNQQQISAKSGLKFKVISTKFGVKTMKIIPNYYASTKPIEQLYSLQIVKKPL